MQLYVLLQDCLTAKKRSHNNRKKKKINKYYNYLYNLRTLPQQWYKGTIVPIYKKGDTHQPGNYRPITLLSSLSTQMI